MNRRTIATLVMMLLFTLLTFGSYFYVKNKNFKLKYEILKRPENFVEARSIKERGYNIITKDGEYYLVICYGEQSTYYSYLKVSNVKTSGYSVEVTVKLPDRDEYASVGEAISYPKAVIKFNAKPKNIKVIYK